MYVALGTSYAFTDESLSYEFFSCQSLDEEHAGDTHMRINMSRAINKIK